MKKNELQNKVKQMYDNVSENFYLCRDDLEVGGQNFNSALLFGVMTELNRGNQLLFGDYGGGKTTSSEILHSAFYGLPLDLVKRVVLRGDPQKTEEKMTGRPDYGAMHQGEEDVVWQHFVLVPPKVIDEFNRIPETNQNVVLNGVDRGDWHYLNESISTGAQPLFATCNYADRGNADLIPPMLDRFDVAVESKFPGVSRSVMIALGGYDAEALENPELTHRALKVLNSRKGYSEIQKGLEEITSGFRKGLAENGIPTLGPSELERAVSEIRQMPLDADAVDYLSLMIAELNAHPKYGQKRNSDPVETSQGIYLNSLVKQGGNSRRADKSIVKYARTLAWMLGEDEVNMEHVATVAPYNLWHRLDFTDDALGKFRDDDRTDPIQLHVTKQLLGQGTNEIPGLQKRFGEVINNYRSFTGKLRSGEYSEARKLAEQFSERGKGHPVFGDFLQG